MYITLWWSSFGVPVGRHGFLFNRDGRGGLDGEERGPVKVQTVVQQHVALFHRRQRDAHHGRRGRVLLRDRRRPRRSRRRGLLLVLLRLLINSCLRHGRRRHDALVRRDRLTVPCARDKRNINIKNI